MLEKNNCLVSFCGSDDYAPQRKLGGVKPSPLPFSHPHNPATYRTGFYNHSPALPDSTASTDHQSQLFSARAGTRGETLQYLNDMFKIKFHRSVKF